MPDIEGDALLCRLRKWIMECRAGDRPGILRPARVVAAPVAAARVTQVADLAVPAIRLDLGPRVLD
jgi:NADPH-dependent ferric siderophore reductase